MFNLIPSDFFDPRGRTDHRGLFAMSIVVLVLEFSGLAAAELAGGALQGAWVVVLQAVLLWVALVAVSRRLHDMGRSAWWLVGGLAL